MQIIRIAVDQIEYRTDIIFALFDHVRCRLVSFCSRGEIIEPEDVIMLSAVLPMIRERGWSLGGAKFRNKCWLEGLWELSEVGEL